MFIETVKIAASSRNKANGNVAQIAHNPAVFCHFIRPVQRQNAIKPAFQQAGNGPPVHRENEYQHIRPLDPLLLAQNIFRKGARIAVVQIKIGAGHGRVKPFGMQIGHLHLRTLFTQFPGNAGGQRMG